jgi:hypothetical protein
VDLKPILATSIGIAIYHAVVAPLIERYLKWKKGPRVQIARRNWRGVYVPDLTIKRVERLLCMGLIGFIGLGFAIGWTIMVHPQP